MSEPTINTAAELAQKSASQIPPSQKELAPNDTRKTLSIARSAQALELRERLQKVLATSGLGARRGMEERILKGEITLNGAVPELGAQVKVGDRIGVDERIFVVKMQEGDFGRILLYNKPDGEVTTRHDPEGRKTVFETLPRLRGSRWIAVGRLDINTQGLLVFTTNGELAQKLMHPENEFEREYLCRVHGEVTEEIVAKLLAGVELEDGPAAVSLIESMDSAGGSNEWWRVVIKEGRNREIRRLWEAVGLTVSRLKRASFGPFTLPKGLHRGELAELDLEDTQKICIEMGISQTPSQLIAEDEAASRLRRNRIVGEGVEGKKRFIAAGKGKAEAFWTGERGYGGAGSRPVRAGGGEFDLGGTPGSERPRDGRPKRGKGPMRGKPGAGRAAFVGPMGMSSFDVNAQSLGGPNSRAPNANARGPRGPRPNTPGGNAGPRNDRRGQRRGPGPSTPLVDAEGAPVLGNDGQARFAPRPNRHRSGPRPAGGRPHNPPQDGIQGQESAAPGAERSRFGGRGNGPNPNQGPREPGTQRGRGPRRDGAGPGQNQGQRRDRPAGEPRVGDIGNRIGESVGRKRIGFMRGALGTAETYDARSIHADSEDFGNRIGGAQPRQPRPENNNRANRPPRSFSGPMDNAHLQAHDASRPEVDGNSARPDGNRQARTPGGNPNGRNPNGRGRGDQRGRNPNAAPQANREPRPPGDARPPREAHPPGEARPPREPRPPRAPALDANGAPIERAPNDGRPRNRNRRRRGPRPDGSAPGAAPAAAPSSNE
jgi:23S rRNA pseudouridine2605 synthase